MTALWRSANVMKSAAATLLLMALLVIAAVHWSSQKAVAIQGPSAMQSVSLNRLWLGVDNGLWVLDAAGRKLSQKTAQELGLSGAVSNIAPAPDGEVLLTTRGQASWAVVRAADMTLLRTITPQWPDDFKGNVPRAIRVAVSPDWDIAVATGGGHTVLLFDKNGTFKARTPKDTYNFTNGLWHSPQGWWTTDTNRFALRLLDTYTLVQKGSIPLTQALSGYDFLGEMVASRGSPKTTLGPVPVATTSRVGQMMEPGFVVDVFADGSQAAYNKAPLAIVQDISWMGDKLLVIDGSTYKILQFSAQREAMGSFGSEEVQRAFASMLDERLFWTNLSSRYMFLLAAGLLLVGMAAYSRHNILAVNAVVTQRRSSTVGTPVVPARLAYKQRFWATGWPWLVRFLVMLFCVLWLADAALIFAANHGFTGPSAWLPTLLLTVCLPIALVALWQQWHYQRLSSMPAYEGSLNREAMTWLLDHDDWDKLRQDGEAPRETLVLRSRWLGWRRQWLLVTNQRVLVFAANARERRLVSEWPRNAVAFAGLAWQDLQGGKPPSRLNRWLLPQVNMRLRLSTGNVVTGICPSAVTATRTAQLLMQARPTPNAAAFASEPESRAARHARRRRRRLHQVFASMLVPGLGQWLQDRFVSGTIYLTAAALLLLFLGPVLWASLGPKMHVAAISKLTSLHGWLLLAAVAAFDAYQFSGTSTRRKTKRTQ